MSYLESIILGVVQGLGEFLPISSSAHLVIFPWAFGFSDPGLTFDVALHFGTLIALIIYFWRDWLLIIGGFFRHLLHFKFKKKGKQSRVDHESYRMMLLLIMGTIPAAIAGLLLNEYAETIFRNPLLVAYNMAALGIFLWIVDRRVKGGKTTDKITYVDGIIVGLMQCFALLPGVSRAGITMTAGLARGFSRVTAARFSFLMAAPITLGACILKAPHFFSSSVNLQALTGIFVSAVVGFLSIKYLLKFVQTYSYRVFVYYRLLFAALVFGYFYIR